MTQIKGREVGTQLLRLTEHTPRSLAAGGSNSLFASIGRSRGAGGGGRLLLDFGDIFRMQVVKYI